MKPNESDNVEGMAASGIKEIKEILKQEKNEFYKNGTFSSATPSQNYTHHPYVTHFFIHLALCNTVMVDYEMNEKGTKKETKYKAASPDELALVMGAKMTGV